MARIEHNREHRNHANKIGYDLFNKLELEDQTDIFHFHDYYDNIQLGYDAFLNYINKGVLPIVKTLTIDKKITSCIELI